MGLQVFICPNCKEVIVADDEIFCSVCMREYHLEDGLLIEQPLSEERRLV